MCAVPILFIFMPISNVFFVCGLPDHSALPLLDIIDPRAFVVVAGGIDHFAKPIFDSLLKVAFENGPISKLNLSLAIPVPPFPLATVGGILAD